MDGILLIDKPPGMSSAEVVRQVKRRLGRKSRVGHLGTLDPFATGLLPILVGEATKLAPFLQENDKEYEGAIRLGIETDTLDPTGRVVREAALPAFDSERLLAIAARFTGTIEQVPPLFSALKRGGVPLYKLARQGREIAPPLPRRVVVRHLELRRESDSLIAFRLLCGTGTYARALARDVGAALESAAHLAWLRRLASGSFRLERAIALTAALAVLESDGNVSLIGLREALGSMPEVLVDAGAERRLRHGDVRALTGMVPRGAGLFKVVSKSGLVAVARTESQVMASLVRIFTEAAA